MLLAQDGCCAICKSSDPGRKKSQWFCVDHDHKTGEVRGLLCNSCNAGLGFLKDSIETLAQAIIYLKQADG